MKKIPSLFKRDYEGTRLVYDEVSPGCEWVLQGEGEATVKLDGTPCLIKDSKMFKRYDAKNGKTQPPDFIPCEEKPDPNTGHWPGWVSVKDNNEDKPFWEAFSKLDIIKKDQGGTFELVGPKIQGNPYKVKEHRFYRHGELRNLFPTLTFEGIKIFLSAFTHEGIVWHHPDGRMAKIKRRDFGFEWPIKQINQPR